MTGSMQKKYWMLTRMKQFIITRIITGLLLVHGMHSRGAKTQLGLDKSEEIKMKAYAVSDSFNGTLSAKSGYETDYKEPIYIYLPKSADAPQVAVNYVEEQKKSASMYDSSKLDERDQYSVFLRWKSCNDRYPVNTDRKTQTSGVQRFICKLFSSASGSVLPGNRCDRPSLLYR